MAKAKAPTRTKCETCNYMVGADGWCPNCTGVRRGDPGVHAIRFEPSLVVPRGEQCPHCGDRSGCIHARARCSECGREGIADAWPFPQCLQECFP